MQIIKYKAHWYRATWHHHHSDQSYHGMHISHGTWSKLYRMIPPILHDQVKNGNIKKERTENMK